MWRNPATNLFRQAFRAAARPGSLSSSTSRFSGLPAPSLRRYCGAAAADGGDGEGNGNAMTYAEAKRLMRLVNVGSLKEKLGMEDKEVIPYAELLEACQTIGVAKSAAEAAAFARVLDEAGVILLFRDRVYLHPDKVSRFLVDFF